MVQRMAFGREPPIEGTPRDHVVAALQCLTGQPNGPHDPLRAAIFGGFR